VIRPVRIPIADCVGYINARTLRARHDEPASDAAAMDGYAVRSIRGRFPSSFRLRNGSERTGPRGPTLRPGEAVAIATGTPLPQGASAVARKEWSLVSGGTLRVRHPLSAGRDVHRQGEDLRRGTVLVRKGEPLRPYHLGVLVAQGQRSVEVLAPRLTIVAIGDELLSRHAARGGPVVRDSISPVIAALTPYADVEFVGPVADDSRSIETALVAAARSSDMIVTIGGTSVGPKDFTKSAVASRGDLLFGGVRVNVLKRGAVGRIARRPVILLPGQVVSAVTVWHEHGLRVLARMMRTKPARTEKVVLSRPLRNRHPMDSVYLFRISEGRATPCRWGVRLYSELLRAQAFGIVPARSSLPRGATIVVQRLLGTE
jgi:molybdopterin molybdotransferase